MRYGQDGHMTQRGASRSGQSRLIHDMKVDPMMPMGPTSKTWNPKADGQFWLRRSGSGEGWAHSSPFVKQMEAKAENREALL